MCLTVVRDTDPRRLARKARQGECTSHIAEDVPDRSGESDAEGDDEKSEHTVLHSIRRAYAALATSSVLEYGASYELLHFAYDLSLWTDLGSKRNLGKGVTLRLMMKNHSFSPEYWRSLHLGAIGLVRQRGFPQLFWTIAPLEWSFPYHEWLRHHLATSLRARMRLAVSETLHIAHVLVEVTRGLVMGATGPPGAWETHLLRYRTPEHRDGDSVADGDDANIGADIAFVIRMEFQDGTRKTTTQDYHGSGRPHLHVLAFVDRPRLLDIPSVVSACMPRGNTECNADLRSYVLGSQIVNEGKTPVEVHRGPTEWDAQDGFWRLHHTSSDHSRGTRAYFPEVLDVLKCHQGLQLSGTSGAWMRYVAKYAAKFSDSMAEGFLNGKASADAIATSVFMRYKPYEPEMVLQMFGARFRQWRLSTTSRGKKEFLVPWPDKDPLPDVIARYESCEWRGDEMSLLEFLRKTNEDHAICGLLCEVCG